MDEAGRAVPAPPRPRARALVALFAAALLVRAVVGAWTTGRGEMEGLAYRYERDAYALSVGYGFAHPKEGEPPQVDLIARADSLGRSGLRLDASRVPAKDPARWRPTGLHPPGYAAWLALLYRLLGPPVIPWARALQAIIDAAACVLVFFLGRRFGGNRVGWIAAWGCALFLPTAYLATSRVADALMPAMWIALFWLWLRAVETRSLARFALAGAWLGGMCLFRPDQLLAPLFFGLGALLVLPIGRAVAGSVVLGLATLLVMIPWGLRNQRAFGEFSLTTHAGGMSLYESIGQFPNPYGIVFDDDVLIAEARKAGFEDIDDPGADRWFKRRFLEVARKNPGFLAREVVRRIPLGIAPLYHWGYDNRSYRGHSFYDAARAGLTPWQAIHREPGVILRAYWDRLIFGVISFVLFCASVGLVLVDRVRWRWGLALALPYLYMFLSHLVVVLGARLLLPTVFVQWIALGALVERLRARRPPETARS